MRAEARDLPGVHPLRRFGDHSSIVRCEQSAKLARYPRSMNAPCGVRIEVTLFAVTKKAKAVQGVRVASIPVSAPRGNSGRNGRVSSTARRTKGARGAARDCAQHREGLGNPVCPVHNEGVSHNVKCAPGPVRIRSRTGFRLQRGSSS